MDLTTIADLRRPAGRVDLALASGEAFLGGGSWLFSEPQLHLTGLVDLTALDWPALTVTGEGLSVAATCTLAEIARWEAPVGWNAHPLFRQCCSALLGSIKVWNVATVGGNICLSLPAGPMTSLAASLDAEAVIWMPSGGERRMPVLEFVVGDQSNALAAGELLRSVEFPLAALRARTAFRKIALAPLGRSGTLVIGRRDLDDTVVVTVTAGVDHPAQFRFASVPSRDELESAIRSIGQWFDDPHGAPDWREAMTVLLAEQVRVELESPPTDSGALNSAVTSAVNSAMNIAPDSDLGADGRADDESTEHTAGEAR